MHNYFFTIIAVIALAIGVSAAPIAINPATNSGYEGVTQNGIFLWRNVTFATIKERFASPKKVWPEDDVIADATETGPSPLQPPNFFTAPITTLAHLYNNPQNKPIFYNATRSLNMMICRPANVPLSTKLPVFWFIWGGGLISGTNIVYDCTQLALDTESVVVIPNYRVERDGFLDVIVEDEIKNSNQGLQDQIIAKEWMKDNIEFFGGSVDLDPSTGSNFKNLTMSGASSGAACAEVHFFNMDQKNLPGKINIESPFRGGTNLRQSGQIPSDSTMLDSIWLLKKLGCRSSASVIDPQNLNLVPNPIVLAPGESGVSMTKKEYKCLRKVNDTYFWLPQFPNPGTGGPLPAIPWNFEPYVDGKYVKGQSQDLVSTNSKNSRTILHINHMVTEGLSFERPDRPNVAVPFIPLTRHQAAIDYALRYNDPAVVAIFKSCYGDCTVSSFQYNKYCPGCHPGTNPATDNYFNYTSLFRQDISITNNAKAFADLALKRTNTVVYRSQFSFASSISGNTHGTNVNGFNWNISMYDRVATAVRKAGEIEMGGKLTTIRRNFATFENPNGPLSDYTDPYDKTIWRPYNGAWNTVYELGGQFEPTGTYQPNGCPVLTPPTAAVSTHPCLQNAMEASVLAQDGRALMANELLLPRTP